MPAPPSTARGLVAVLALGVLVAVLALAAGPVRAWVERAAAPCAVTVDGERVPLDRDQARLATASAASRGPAGEVADDAASATSPADAADGIPQGVVEAIRGARAETALTCRTPEPARADAEVELTEVGLTPRAQTVLGELQQTFGDLPTGGYAPGGVDSGHGAESTHYEGRAVDVFFRPVSEENLDAGWVLAQWLVARADELTVQYVIFDDHWWGVRQSGRGWQDYRAPGGSDDPVLRHLDHVHVDVVRGG